MLIIGLMNFDKIYNLFAGNEDASSCCCYRKEELYSTIHQVFKMSIVRYKLNVARINKKQNQVLKW